MRLFDPNSLFGSSPLSNHQVSVSAMLAYASSSRSDGLEEEGPKVPASRRPRILRAKWRQPLFSCPLMPLFEETKEEEWSEENSRADLPSYHQDPFPLTHRVEGRLWSDSSHPTQEFRVPKANLSCNFDRQIPLPPVQTAHEADENQNL